MHKSKFHIKITISTLMATEFINAVMSFTTLFVDCTLSRQITNSGLITREMQKWLFRNYRYRLFGGL